MLHSPSFNGLFSYFLCAIPDYDPYSMDIESGTSVTPAHVPFQKHKKWDYQCYIGVIHM